MSDDCNDIFCDGGELPIPAPAVPVVPIPAVPAVGGGGGGGGGGGVNCGQFVSAWAQTCALTISGCPGQMCNTCPDSIDDNIRSCCNADPPVTCFQSVLGAGGSGGSPASTPATVTDANLASCATAIAYVSACQSLTSNFQSLAPSEQASCLCYDANNNFAPSTFDGAWAACASYASTSDMSDFAFFTSNEGFCASAVNGAAASGSGSGTPTTTAGGATQGTATPTESAQSGGTLAAGTATSTGSSSSGTAASPSASKTGSAARRSVSKTAVMLPLFLAVGILSGAINSVV